jgi:hypothetical protein
MFARSGTLSHASREFRCHRCGNVGTIHWDETAPQKATALTGSTADFFRNIPQNAPYPIRVVCNGCGDISIGQPHITAEGNSVDPP